jgi:Ca-activated chloride channel family protein
VNPSIQKNLAERLAALGPNPQPPADLLDKLVAELPPRLTLAPEIADPPNVARPSFGNPRRWMALAATLVAVVGGTFVGLRVLEQGPEPVSPPAEKAALAAPGTPVPPPPPPAAKLVEQTALAVDDGAEPEILPETRRQLESLGYPGAKGRADVQPVEIPEVEFGVEGGVEGGIPGGVVGGVPGGVPGGTVGGTPSRPTSATDRYYNYDSFEELRVPPGAPQPAPAKQVPQPSTGGTAEPNDQPYGDVFYQDYGTNPFLDPAEDRFSTFALDVDTGSYGVVRRYLGDGHLPPAAAIRVEELLNAFDYRDEAPREGDFAIHAEGATTPFGMGDRYRVLRFGLKAREIDAADRKSAVLTFVVDVSGSMDQENRLGLVKKALGLLLDRLREDDRVALVVYGDDARVIEPGTSDLERLRSAIERLVPEGATNAEAGLRTGYDLARRTFRQGAINRVILCSDGVANVGATGSESILDRIGREAREGIELTTIGFGMGNYNDVLMEQLADRGNGRYAYVDTLIEARRLFVEELTGTLETVAADAKAQLELDPRWVDRYRLIGYENRDVADHRFRDDKVDAGEIGAGHAVTALYELKLQDEVPPEAVIATLRLRYRSVAAGRVIEQERPVLARDLAESFERSPRALQLAAVVAELGEILKGTYWAREGDLRALFLRAERLAADDFAGDVRVSELAQLIGRAAELWNAEGR